MIKSLLRLMVLSIAGSLINGIAHAEFPERPIELIIMSKEGGGQDLASRMIGDVFAKHIGTTIKYSNKPGASGRIALETFLAAKSDGYTLFAPNIETIMFMYGINRDKLEFEWKEKIEWLGAHIVDPGVLITHSDRPWTDINAFIDDAKRRKVRVGVPNWASAETLSLLQLQEQTGARFEIIPYSGGNKALTAILGDQIEAGLLKYAVTQKAKDDIRYLGIFQKSVTVGTDISGLAPVNQSLGTEVSDVASLRSLAVHASISRDHPDVYNKIQAAYSKALVDPELVTRATNLGIEQSQIIAWSSDEANEAAASILSALNAQISRFEAKNQ